MKIAIDVSPLESGHAIRGVGFYLSNLKKSLLHYYPENEYVFFKADQSLDESVDLVHYPYFDPFSLTLPFFKKNKTVVTVHDLIPIIFPKHFSAGIKGNLRWHIQKYMLAQTDGIIAISETTKKDILKITEIDKNKIAVTYLAAGDEFHGIRNQESIIKEVKSKYNLPEKFALYVGDVTWNKNIP